MSPWQEQGCSPSHLLWGAEPLHLKAFLLCRVLQKPSSRDDTAKPVP